MTYNNDDDGPIYSVLNSKGPCANPCEAGQVRYYESVGNGTYENCIHGGTGHEICCECA